MSNKSAESQDPEREIPPIALESHSRYGADVELVRILAHLRHLIERSGYTQEELQQILGWGRSYISQILTRQKKVRFEQIYLILNVIGVAPWEFWDSLYGRGERAEMEGDGVQPAAGQIVLGLLELEMHPLELELRRLRGIANALVTALQRKQLIWADELERAVRNADRGMDSGEGSEGLRNLLGMP